MSMEERVLEALREVIDPEVGINIVDLGLVEAVDAGDERIYVGLIMTTPACPQSGHLAEESECAIWRHFDDVPVEVEVLDSPFWTPDRMSEIARQTLGWGI